MAVGTKRGGKDVVLGGRHLVGFFFLLVVVLGVVFTLGYLLGRSQYDPHLSAAASGAVAELPSPAKKAIESNSEKSAKPNKPDASVSVDSSPPASPPVPAKTAKADDAVASAPPPTQPPDWDFYHSAEPAKANEKLAPPPPPPPAKKPALVPASNRSANSSNRSVSTGSARPFNSPLIPRGSTVLQVAALARQADALSLAQALQQKKFPAFVLPPDADHFYRVQVGPYTDAKAANAARQRLDKQGFKYIIKR